MIHQVQHTVAGDGIEFTAADAVVTVKIAGEHTDDSYELFEVDAPRGPTTPIIDEVAQPAREVLSRHGVTVVDFEPVYLESAR
jgi:hypothetical protein